ncbi:MAG TPA: hypothetical protein VM513_27695 [Kofleriaceae bacterium]|jgi:hypothetical protein|nr:hypothetical protein [Kofleriaceae bacterium]
MATTIATADGWFKEIYGEAVNSVPSFALYRERIKFKDAERLGDSYHFPVRLTRSHGWTLASGATAGTAFALNAVRTGAMKDATLSGSSFVMRESFAYKAVASAVSSGKTAFGNLLDDAVEDMLETTNAILEITMRYGGSSLGVNETAGAASSPQDFVITAASSAMGMWAMLENAELDAYDSTLTTQRNSNAAIVLTKAVYSATTGKVTLSVTGNTTDLDALVSTDVFVLRGMKDGAMTGVDAIATNTGSLFGISASTYSTWSANTYSAGSAAATMGKLTQAAGLVAMRVGQMPLVASVSIPTWSNLNNDTAALRRLTKNEGRVELGAQSIVYHGPTGPLEIVPDAMCKGGEAFIQDFDEYRRVGASDVTFNLPGVDGKIQNDRFFRELADNAGFEIRSFWDQGIILRKPRTLCKVTDIVNSNA